jgi:hypothetical protein
MTKEQGERPVTIHGLLKEFLRDVVADPARTAAEGKRRASCQFFLECYEDARPEVLRSFRDRVLPALEGPSGTLREALRAWKAQFFLLPDTFDLVWSAASFLALMSRTGEPPAIPAVPYREPPGLGFTFACEGWRLLGREPIKDAKRRVREAFEEHLRTEASRWELIAKAYGSDHALSESEKEGLRLLALRQAHGWTYPELADMAKPLRRRRDEAQSPEEARRKVHKAARLIGLAVREGRTGRRPRLPKTPK